MIPAALYSANYAPLPYGELSVPPKATSFWANDTGGNVIAVDFKRRTPQTAEVDDDCSGWKKVTAERLDRLREYDIGWDGPASTAISRENLARAGRLIALAFEGVPHPAPPAAVPCADGSLQLEWWLVDTRFELSIETDGSLSAWAENRLTNEESEAEGKDATNLLFQWARRLTADKFIQPA